MKILLSPQVADDVIEYKFKDEKISVTINGVTETFDFTGVPEGQLELTDPETGKELLETNLPVIPIISAKKESGILWVELLNWISEDSSHEDRFPDWIDSSEYNPLSKTKPTTEGKKTF